MTNIKPIDLLVIKINTCLQHGQNKKRCHYELEPCSESHTANFSL